MNEFLAGNIFQTQTVFGKNLRNCRKPKVEITGLLLQGPEKIENLFF